MMLVTVTFDPASCRATLPQKFSAATTWTAGAARCVVFASDAAADDAIARDNTITASRTARRHVDPGPIQSSSKLDVPALATVSDTETQSRFGVARGPRNQPGSRHRGGHARRTGLGFRRALRGSPKLLGLRRTGEEVDQQLVDPFRLVVVYPVRCVGQALHAVEG